MDKPNESNAQRDVHLSKANDSALPALVFREDFLMMPLDLALSSMPAVFTEKELVCLMKHLEHAISSSSTEELMQGTIHYWLTCALHGAILVEAPRLARAVVEVFHKIAKKDPEVAVALLQKTINTGTFHGQTMCYAWINALYSATFDVHNSSVIMAIHYVFLHLLENDGRNMIDLLTHRLSEGKEQGNTALLLLARALLQTAGETDIYQPNTTLIAEFVVNLMARFPLLIGSEITQDINQGSFDGKSILYVLVCALKALSNENSTSDEVNRLCSIFTTINHTDNQQNLANALLKKIDSGPYRAANTLHILLKALVSAIYIRHNDAVIERLITCLQDLFATHQNQISLSLSEPIDMGKYIHENGIQMLMQTLMVASDRQLDTTALAGLISSMIDTDPDQLPLAFIHCIPESNDKYNQRSPLRLLIGALDHSPIDSTQRDNIMRIITKLASNQRAVEMVSSLPSQERTIFIDEIAKINPISLLERAHLMALDYSQVTQLSHRATEPDRFFTKSATNSEIPAPATVSTDKREEKGPA